MGLRFERRGKTTALTHCRFTLPLQALTPAHLEDGTASLMILNPTGGLLGGDHLVTRIKLGQGAHACLTTPSATRVYRTAQYPAVQESVIEMDEDATLEYFPDHVIPHAGARLRQSLRLEMAAGSRTILWDAVAAGRVAHGERWDFKDLDSRVEVFLCGQPAFINRTKINPAARPPRQLGMMEEFNYVASLLTLEDRFAGWSTLAGLLNAQLDALPQIAGGVGLLARGGCVVRLLAKSAPDLNCAAKTLWKTARKSLLGLAAFDTRKY